MEQLTFYEGVKLCKVSNSGEHSAPYPSNAHKVVTEHSSSTTSPLQAHAFKFTLIHRFTLTGSLVLSVNDDS